MPGKIKVKVLAGRNLPVMDRAADTTDAFVEIKFGGVTHKTDVCRKSLNPHWNSTEWYRFEVDDSELQDEPLQLRLMDHDTYSANDAIGKVVVSLAPLLAREPLQTSQRPAHTGAIMSGWIPVFDTMHGIRGELNIIVKVELFSDFNKFRQSSCGVHFFHCPSIPAGYRASAIHGFVEELVVNDDPEYQWIDKIRTPRASNEARQVAFIKLSNQVQRLVGLKAAELGANAVVGYKHAFDLEGESGVVARAIGTAVTIVALPTPCQPLPVPSYTQQQMRKYLEILAMDDENITDLNEYFQTHQEQLHKLMGILHPKLSSNYLDDPNADDDDNCELTRQTSIKSYADSVSIYQDHLASESLQNIAEDQIGLRKLLNPNEEICIEPTGPFRRIKMFRQSGFLSKKLSNMRRKDKQNEDQISLKSNSSDTSRISVTDIKSEFKKFKKLRKPKFRRSTSSENAEGMGMASVLARSILHAHTSLACIAETQDSGDSPCSTLRRRTSESEPAISHSDDEHAVKIVTASPDDKITEENDEDVPEVQEKNINEDQTTNSSLRVRKKSESCPATPVPTQKNFLKVPDEDGYFGASSSTMSVESSEPYSSSEEEDESSETRTDIDRSFETLTSVVKSVLEHKADPALIAQMEKKLDDLSRTSDSTDSPERQDDRNVKSLQEASSTDSTGQENYEKELDGNREQKSEPVPMSTVINPVEAQCTHFKFHNPFVHKTASKSISLPSSPNEKKGKFMSLSSVRIKQHLSRISKSNLIKSLSHMSLRPKKKENEYHVSSQANSASNSDVKSLSPSRQTVLGSPFMSYSDLLSLASHQIENVESPTSLEAKHFDNSGSKPFAMYIGSEPVSRTSLSGPSSPNKLSMTRPDDIHIFNDYKHHKRGSEPTSPTVMKASGLLHTAMETILMDRVQSLMIPTSPTADESKEKEFIKDIKLKLEKLDDSKREPNRDAKMDCSKKLVRQDSVYGSAPDISKIESGKMSTESDTHSFTSSRSIPVLQHLHPIMCGGHGPKLSFLETIPSLPEYSFDRSVEDQPQANIDSVEADPPESKTESAETLDPSIVCNNSHAEFPAPVDREKGGSPRGVHARAESYGGKEQHTPTPLSSTMNGTHPPVSTSLNATSAPVGMHRRSSDSDLSITPKGSSLTMSGAGNTSAVGGAILRPSMNTNNLEMLEYPFLTMTEYPPSFIVHIGGMVCARSVKLMDGAEGASRVAWWAELRTELRAHARALRCTAVLGYTESATICEDVCILSASGTAAVIDLETDFTGDPELNISLAATQMGSAGDTELLPTLDEEAEIPVNCALAHVPYSASGMPYRAELSICALCRRARVPAVMLSTLERPRGLPAAGRSCLVTAAAARARRTAPNAEPAARDLSDQLPFLEYELHRLLLAKLYIQGANALFGLRTQIAVGERAVVALATGTGALITALPAPRAPKLKPSDGMDVRDTSELQRALHEALAANRARNGFEPTSPNHKEPPPDMAEEPPALELCGDKDACVLELDEAEDVETARALAVQRPRHLVAATTARVCGVRPAPGARPHAFAQVWRARLSLSGGGTGGGGGGAAERHIARALDGIHYKLRRLAPAALADLRFQLDLPEDEMQLLVSGVAIPLADLNKPESNGPARSVTSNATNRQLSKDDGAETIFSLDEEQVTPPRQSSTEKQSGDEKSLSPPVDQSGGSSWSGIVVTPLPLVSGARCQRWLCALQLLFVRETSSVRELGGLSGLLHTFITEVLAIVRAYTAALGGNALASFYITELMLQENPHKNQGQCLLSVGGDVIHVTY